MSRLLSSLNVGLFTAFIGNIDLIKVNPEVSHEDDHRSVASPL